MLLASGSGGQHEGNHSGNEDIPTGLGKVCFTQFQMSTHESSLDPYLYKLFFSAHIRIWALTGAQLALSQNFVTHVWALYDNPLLKIGVH